MSSLSISQSLQTDVNMLYKGVLTAFSVLALTALGSADGLYSKGSAVLQVDGKNYNKLIAKSNQVSVSMLVSIIGRLIENVNMIT